MVISFQNVSRVYPTRHGDIKALDSVNLRIKEGEFLVARGPSGSGKTTLLLCAGGMLRPTEGEIIFGGVNIVKMNERERAAWRAENIGFVFQMFHLIPYLTVLENVMLPRGINTDAAIGKRAREIIQRLNLSRREQHKPSELSAGERQRVAIARAMLNDPTLILADEPTGNLDPQNAEEVIGYLADYHKSGGTVVVVTHGTTADRYAQKIIHLREGRIVEPDAER